MRLDPNIAGRSSTLLIGKWPRHWFVWVIGPIERLLVKSRVSPTTLNVSGALFGGLAGVAFAMGDLIAAGSLVLVGGLADVLDGRVARARLIASDRGAFLDSTLDRFSESFAYIGVAVFLSGTRAGLVASTAALGGSMLVSYARARGEALGVSNSSGLMQRPERLILLALGAFVDRWSTVEWSVRQGAVLTVVLSVVAVGSYATAIYRTIAIAKELHKKEGAPTHREKLS